MTPGVLSARRIARSSHGIKTARYPVDEKKYRLYTLRINI